MKSKQPPVGRGLMLTGALTLGALAVGVERSGITTAHVSNFVPKFTSQFASQFTSQSTSQSETMGGGSISSDFVTASSKQIAQFKTIRPKSAFSQQQIDYFMEVALGAEYGQDLTPKVRKWSGDIRIQVFGQPTPADLSTLQAVIRELNALVKGAIRLQFVDRTPNLTLHFAPESQFRQLEPAYVPLNFGFFVTRWNNRGNINRANVLIATTGITQKERSHLIREELTQSLGLMRDSYRYADSMFYQPWTDITRFSELDKALIQMLYMPELKPGMTKAETLRVLNSAQARTR